MLQINFNSRVLMEIVKRAFSMSFLFSQHYLKFRANSRPIFMHGKKRFA